MIIENPLWVLRALLHELGEVGLAHVAVVHQRAVESEGDVRVHHHVALLGEAQVLAQQGTIDGMSGMLNDLVGALDGILAAQVGDTLVGDDDVHRVGVVVGIGNHGHDGADAVVLLDRRAQEDADVGVAGEVARTAHTVHQARTADVGRVDVAIDVGLDGGVHRDDAQTADHLGVVADLAGTHEHLAMQGLALLEELGHGAAGEGHRAGAGKLALAALEQLEDAVLDYLGVHLKRGDVGALVQGVEHGVGDVAHTTLQGQELLGDAALLELVDEEGTHVVADGSGHLIDGGEGALLADGQRSLDNAEDLLGVDMGGGGTHAVMRRVDGNLATVRRVVGGIDIVHAADGLGNLVVDLDNHLVGHLEPGGGVAHRGAQHEFTVVGDALCLDDGDVHLAVEAIAELLCQLAQVAVVIVDSASVDGLAHVGV